MKNNKLKLLYNPFNQIAGWKAFGFGVVVTIIAACLGYLFKIAFDGAIDIHYAPELSLAQSFVFHAIGIISIASAFYLFAVIFAKGTRFQDVLGTTTLARYPYVFAVFTGFIMPDIDFNHIAELAVSGRAAEIYVSGADIVRLVVASLIMIVISVWFIALLYNAFRVSTGLKGGKCVGLFIAALFVAEVLSKILIYCVKF